MEFVTDFMKLEVANIQDKHKNIMRVFLYSIDAL